MSVRHWRLLAGSVRAHGPHCAMFRNLLTSLAKEPITVGSRASRSFSVPTIGLLVPKLVEARNGFQGQSAMPHMLSLGRYAWPQLQELISAHKRYGYSAVPLAVPFASAFPTPFYSLRTTSQLFDSFCSPQELVRGISSPLTNHDSKNEPKTLPSLIIPILPESITGHVLTAHGLLLRHVIRGLRAACGFIPLHDKLPRTHLLFWATLAPCCHSGPCRRMFYGETRVLTSPLPHFQPICWAKCLITGSMQPIDASWSKVWSCEAFYNHVPSKEWMPLIDTGHVYEISNKT